MHLSVRYGVLYLNCTAFTGTFFMKIYQNSSIYLQMHLLWVLVDDNIVAHIYTLWLLQTLEKFIKLALELRLCSIFNLGRWTFFVSIEESSGFKMLRIKFWISHLHSFKCGHFCKIKCSKCEILNFFNETRKWSRN